MVQVLPAVESFGTKFARSVSEGAAEGYENVRKNRLSRDEMLQENKEIEQATGIKMPTISNPELRKTYLAEQLKSQGRINANQAKIDAQVNALGLGQPQQEQTDQMPEEMEQEQQPWNRMAEDAVQSTFGETPARNKKQARGPHQPQQPKPTGKPPHTPEEIAKAALVNSSIANTWQRQNEEWERNRRHEEEKDITKQSEKNKRFESDRDFHSKTSGPLLEHARNVVSKYPLKKGLVNQQRLDISSGKVEGIGPFLVERTGLEALRSPEEARFKAAAKQRFLDTIETLGGGARMNQFLEQQVAGGQAAIGRPQEANLTTLDLEEFRDDLQYQRAKYEIDLAKEDQDKYGYVKNDVADRANDKMADYAKKRQEEMATTIRTRHENNMSNDQILDEIVGKKVASDTPLTKRTAALLMIKNGDDEHKAFAEAKRLGFRIPRE